MNLKHTAFLLCYTDTDRRPTVKPNHCLEEELHTHQNTVFREVLYSLIVSLLWGKYSQGNCSLFGGSEAVYCYGECYIVTDTVRCWG